MRRFPVPVLLVLALLASGPGCRSSRASTSVPAVATADELFSTATLPRFDLTLDQDAQESLGKKQRKFVRGTFSYAGVRYADVGIRLKGHRAMQSLDGKPAFKIDFDKYVPDRKFLGLGSLTLNNLVEDPTMLRETLAYRVFRAAGVPAPRTGFAEVYVNGQLYGLYLTVESVDTAFLAARGVDTTGNVYEGEYGCDLYPDDVAGFDHETGADESRADLTALAAVASGPTDGLFGDGAPLDTPRVLAYLAVSALLGDFDGYRHSHNYRMVHDPAKNKWTYIPWGLDRTFKKHLTIYDSGGLLARRCFADATCRRAYVSTMRTVVDQFEALHLAAALPGLASFVQDASVRDWRKPYSPDETAKQRRLLAQFIAERAAEVRAQLGCLDAGAAGVAGGEVDADGDGYGCLDCNDADASVHPGAADMCGDHVDNDCSGNVDDAPTCDCPTKEVDGVTFYLCALPMTWDDAAAFCAAQGHTLARIDSEKQSKKLFKAARKLAKDRWWIGLTDRGVEGEFHWDGGAPLASGDFTRWAKHQPDNDGCNEDCVALKEDGGGKWHDTHCGQQRPFICR